MAALLTGNASLQTVTGKTSLPVAKVSVNGTPAAIANGTNFTANVPLPGGTNTFSVVAQDASGHTETQRFSAQITGATPIQPTYDKNGNTLTDEKGYKYTWDSLNRLISITYPTGAKSLFAYDGLSRRVQITEQSSGGAVTSTKNYLWVGSEIAEERDTTNTVQKRFFPQGEQQAGVSYYYTRDHLGSVREIVSGAGNVVSRYSYDPYGRTTLVSGSNLATFQYTDDYQHQASGLNLTMFRAYDVSTGRWLSRDSIGEGRDNNLYGYVVNNPVEYIDPLGLTHKCYKRLLITEFNDQTGTNDNNLGPGDAASGVPGYTSSDFGPDGKVLPNHVIHKKGVYPRGTKMDIYPGPRRVTINDSGAGYAESRRRLGIPDGVPVDSWIDVWTKDGNGNPIWLWVSITIKDNCKCPAGWSDNPRADRAHTRLN